MIIERANEIGLELNHRKCEISFLGPYSKNEADEIMKMFQLVSPGIQVIQSGNEFLLNTPLTDQAAVVCLDKKILDLQRLSVKLTNISAHSAYFLLRISITTPRLIFFLRGTPMWRNITGLQRYDEVLKESLESLLNIQLTPRAWSESSLPIKKGGIGIRHATEVALPCFLSSIYNVSDLLDDLLSEEYRQIDPSKLEAEELWCNEFGELPAEGLRKFQHVWESNTIKDKISSLSTSFENKEDKDRFLANSVSETGAWLQALPSPQLGTHLSNDEFRVAMSLRLGTPIVQPHVCGCGDKVDKFGRHGLSCSKAKGTRYRHALVNDLLQRGLRSAEIPAVREPPGCSRPDGKQPDGLTLLPWANGKSLLWDYTCRDTFAPSYLNSTSKHVGYAAKQAENKKINHYSDLANQFIFVPVATETSGIFGKLALELVRKIGSKIAIVSNEKRSTSYLIQRILVSRFQKETLPRF